MRLRRIGLGIMLAGAVAGCSPSAPAVARDTPRAIGPAGLTRAEAIERARAFVAQHQAAAAAVHLDSTQAEAVDSLWRVTFRRRAMVAPAFLTVDVDRRTGAMRFPGDE